MNIWPFIKNCSDHVNNESGLNGFTITFKSMTKVKLEKRSWLTGFHLIVRKTSVVFA